MNVYQTTNALTLSPSQSSLDRLFAVARKTTVIQLRWPLVILSSYLLLYSPGEWLAPMHTEAVVVFYLITNTTLYFLSDSRFESPYFYGPLLLFDTVFLALVLGISGTTTSEFYIACFFTVVLSLICNDARGLLVLTILAPVLYGYVAFQSDTPLRADIYLRLPFPLVISIFYGYFAQVERLRLAAKINHERLSREHSAAEELRVQRKRLEVLHQVNSAAADNSDSRRSLETFLEKALIHLPYAAALVRLTNQNSGIMETAASAGFLSRKLDNGSVSLLPFDEVVKALVPLNIEDIFSDTHNECIEFFRAEGLVASLGVPIVADGKTLGSLTFFMRSQYHVSDEEKDFISTVAGQLAISIQHARLLAQLESRVNQLHESNKINDDIVRVISKDLNTPLKTITGYTTMLIEGSLGQITPIQEKALQTIVRQAKDLNAMVGSVFQVSCIQSKVFKAEPHQTNFWEFLYDLRSSYDSPPPNDVTLLWDFSPDLPTVDVDRGKLKQILQKLIDNAIVFTERGRVTVSARYLASEKRMEMKVADTGGGISSDSRRVIFENFRQGKTSETHGDRGVCLGLYIVKKLVELLNGSVVIDNSVGEGSTFTLQIPCEEVSVPSSSPMLPFTIQAEVHV